jgi:hypothetical protein
MAGREKRPAVGERPAVEDGPACHGCGGLHGSVTLELICSRHHLAVERGQNARLRAWQKSIAAMVKRLSGAVES